VAKRVAAVKGGWGVAIRAAGACEGRSLPVTVNVVTVRDMNWGLTVAVAVEGLGRVLSIVNDTAMTPRWHRGTVCRVRLGAGIGSYHMSVSTD
jgi:hypothetical protein